MTPPKSEIMYPSRQLNKQKDAVCNFLNTHYRKPAQRWWQMSVSDGGRVLIVNDDQNMLHLLKHAFEERGMYVECTTSLADAVSLGKDHEYDVVILEEKVQEAGMQLRAAGCRTPFLLMSGRVGVDHVVRMVSGMVRYAVA